MRSVVSGVDQDPQSTQVLRKALAEAQTTGRPLQVLHAWSAPSWPSAAVALDDALTVQLGSVGARELVAGLLAEALESRIDTLPVRASAQARQGDAGELLVDAGVEAGLLVVGARHHGPVLSLVLGSATGFVLRHALCPVMVVPPTATAGPYRRIVLGYDEPARAGSALRWALDAARRHGCPLLVLHALPLTPAPTRRSAQETDAHQQDEVHRWLAGQVARSARGYSDVAVSTAVRDGSALDVLLGQAGVDDLLVLGSRARGSLSEVFLGAVAVQCAQRATGAVVVVRVGQERLATPAAGPVRVTFDPVVHGPCVTAWQHHPLPEGTGR